jgi:undecaprenyl-diphosphatase
VYGIVVIVLGARLAAPVRRRLLVAAAVWVTLVAASRVLLGVHFPTDVLGGVALGVLWVAVALLAVPWRQENDKRHPAG